MVDIEKNESLLFDGVDAKIRNFVYDIQNNIWDNFNNTNVSKNFDDFDNYYKLMGFLLNSRFNYWESQTKTSYGKIAKRDYLEIEKKYNELKERSREFNELEKEALLNEMKVYCSKFTDNYGIKYKYEGDGTSEKKGDVILESDSRIKKISYKGITYESKGKITFKYRDYRDDIIISYNSEEKNVEFRNENMLQQPELIFKVDIKEDELFIDTVINLLNNWMKENEIYKTDSKGTNSKQQYDKISTTVDNLNLFKQMLKNEFVTYRLFTENVELKRKNEQIEPLQLEVETKKNENEQLNAEVAKKDDELTKVSEESFTKDSEISGLKNRVEDLEANQRFLFATLKELTTQIDKVNDKKIVFSSDLKKLQGYTEASMSATQLQGIEESKKM